MIFPLRCRRGFAVLLLLTLAAVLGGCQAPSASDPLSLWNDGAPAKTALLDYVAAVTDAGSPDYIPPRERIAVFDLDGTLYCETDPTYVPVSLYLHRTLDDPAHAPAVTAAERRTAQTVRTLLEQGRDYRAYDSAIYARQPHAYAGLSEDEFAALVRNFISEPAPGYQGMTRGEAFYRPMLELISYLQAQGFTIFISSGTDRFAVRAIIDGVIDIPPHQVLGTDVEIRASGQGTQSAQDYTLRGEDRLLRTGAVLGTNLRTAKVTGIVQEIGSVPVLVFGNSSGDTSMAVFGTRHNRHRSMAFMVLCDDVVRENGNPAAAEKMRALCAQYGFVPISMKNDWRTIFGHGVTRRPAPPAP